VNTFVFVVMENPSLLLEFQRYPSDSRRYKYFLFSWPYSYFRLSDVVEITVFDLAMVDSFSIAAPKQHDMYIVFLLKRLGAFFTPKCNEHVENRSAIMKLKIIACCGKTSH